MMKKLLLILTLYTLLVACSNEPNNAVINVPDSTTTNTALPFLPADVEEVTTTSTTSRTPDPTNTTVRSVAPKPVPKPSGSIGRISIPSIGVDWAIVEGIELSQLNKGPGHYPHSPKPCRAGNAAIAGHRTTYGAPFNKLDLLKNGDLINITTPEGDCTYKYLRTEIVSPNNVSVVMPKDGNVLTLTACHPKGSAKQRIVVTATLENVTLK